MSITAAQLRELPDFDGNVVAPDGSKIGGIGQVYLDDQSGDPSWVTAKTGLFGTSQSFVPLEGASLQGRDIQVAYDEHKVKDAPRVDDDGALSPQEEDKLYGYYGVGTQDTAVPGTASDLDDRDATVPTGTADAQATDTRTADRDQVGHDTSGPTTDDAMTRSEERLQVGTQTREAGRARLRKYVVTENVTQTVPVSHEEVRVVREPITDANVGDATSGPSISEEEHEVVLHEERPVVAKETVPVERIRLDKETVTEQATVSEDVRKEQIDTDVDPDVTAPRNS
ncbi:MAG TPA: YsnF/AvaK domain-containing protein [Friedmanniella sp.]